MKRLIYLVIILSVTVSSASEMCIHLFPTRSESLKYELGLVNSENDMRVFDQQFQSFDMMRALKGDGQDTSDVAKAMISAAFQGRWSSKHVHEGLIEKRAKILVQKLDVMFNPDKYGVQNKEIRDVIFKARVSLVAIGMKRYAEMNGLVVEKHFSYRNFAAARMTLWHDILKPAVKLFVTFSIPYRSVFTETEAMDILWNGVYSPGSIIWNNAYKQNAFMKLWSWWTDVSPKTIIAIASTGLSLAVIFGGGMVYKAYLNQHTENVAQAVEQAVSLKSLRSAIMYDAGTSVYHGILEKYREQNQGQEPSADYKAETKRKVLEIWPDAKIEDE